MSLPSISLKRPVMALVLNIIIVIFGVIGFDFLGVRDYPSIDPPIINVRTSYAGANPDIVESQITEPLEKSINGIAGIKSISSTSALGNSSISVEFDLRIDLEAAANDVRDKVSQAVRNLPQDIDAPPVVSKSDASAGPIISMTVESHTKNQLELTEYAENVLVERLQTIPGVSYIRIWGEKRYAMRMWLDPLKMAGYGITFSDVQVALNKQNIELPSGKLSGQQTELSVRTFGRLYTEEDFNNLIIKNVNGTDVRFREIGEAALGPENEETILKESNVPMIALAITPQPGSNYVAIADEFYKRYEEIKKDVPEDFTLNVALDNTQYIKKSISEVEETLFVAIALVIIIIYLFFRDWRIALRPLLDIPVSLIGAFFIMYLMGFTINILTLLAVVLATGLVVDDGIVVTENIYKKLEKGMEKHRAAKEGSEEIYFAIIATSITLAIVFIPIIFLQGFTGSLFKEFGVVVAGAVLISAFVSLTLTPVLNVFLTKEVHKPSKFYIRTEPFFAGMENGYSMALRWIMKHKWIATTGIVATFALIILIGRTLQTELAPMEDKNRFRLAVSAPEGTSYDAMENYMNNIVDMLIDSVPEKRVILSVTAPGFTGSGAVNTGFSFVPLIDASERERSQNDIVQMVNSSLGKFNYGKAFALQEQTISVQRGGSNYPIVYILQNINFDKLSKALPRFLEEANNNPILQGVDADLKFNKPELTVSIDREKASRMGISIEEVAQTLQFALSNKRLGYFTKNGKQYQLLGQVLRESREAPLDLKQFYVRTNTGEMVSIDNLVQLEETTSPAQMYHYNRYKSATISAGLAPGYTIGDGLEAMDEIYAKLKDEGLIDDSFTTSLGGSSKDFAESSSNTSFAFILALILIYLVLSAQFESFIDPFIIMLTVPLAIAGALLSLWLFGHTLNIFSEIGMIMLIGLVTKNGILIVEYANRLRDQGATRTKAAIEAAGMRLRPILMTSFAMMFGALPLALSLGAASTSRIPLGIVIVGGILFSLLLSLFIVPVMYTFLSRRKTPASTAILKLDE
ncbi:MAG: efflux RND transporter permease subunit [Chitinophagales bacterium]|nr:efflux RND transporter permease subunit [Chitinophagales bacterium]